MVSVDEKLAWLFKLYDKDSNGEIVQEEMEDIFLKLCRIVEKTEVDHFKKHAKLAEEERKKKGDEVNFGSQSDFPRLCNWRSSVRGR